MDGPGQYYVKLNKTQKDNYIISFICGMSKTKQSYKQNRNKHIMKQTGGCHRVGGYGNR